MTWLRILFFIVTNLPALIQAIAKIWRMADKAGDDEQKKEIKAGVREAKRTGDFSRIKRAAAKLQAAQAAQT